MIRKAQPLIFLIFILLISSCQFISNAFEYRRVAEEFTEALLVEDYDQCLELFAMENGTGQSVDFDTLQANLLYFRELIINNFGEELEYTFMKAEKKFSTVEEENPPNTTNVLVQIENKEKFGVLTLLFDDHSQKILHINTLDIKEEIPSMWPFGLFGFLVLCIPVFNIYVINQVRKSNLKRKWLKYVAIVFLNVPAITYSAIGGLGFKLLNFQILLGMSFSYMGYMNSMWVFGIPFGGIYWLWKLKRSEQ